MKRTTYSILAIALGTAACGPPASLLELNKELSSTSLSEALSTSEHFRPLCDANGYPVVGNINGKVVTTASEFCDAVREGGQK